MRCKFFIILLIVMLIPTFSFASYDLAEADSPAAILVNVKTGKVVYEKNAYERMYPASTTKIMTAILVLESGLPLTDTATVSETAINSIPEGYVTSKIQAGEKFTIEQLLPVLLIPSANDVANVLAEHISGSVEAFAEKMNEKALEIGCKNTHFLNPSGIHNENHYSTAYDLSLIASYAMQNDVFRKIVQRTSCSLPATDLYPSDDRVFDTTNALLIKESSYYYPYAIGVKTGFTTPAGNCLVACSLKNDIEWISVVLGAVQTEEHVSQRYNDTIRMLKYADTNFIFQELKKANDIVDVTTVPYTTESLNLLASEDVSVLVNTANTQNEFSPEIVLKENLSAPIYKGEVVGTAIYTVENTKYEVDLIAGNDILLDSVWSFAFKVVMLILLLAIIYILLFPPEFLRKKWE